MAERFTITAAEQDPWVDADANGQWVRYADYAAERERWINYTTDLQRIIEALCGNRKLPQPVSTARHHYNMAERALAERAGGVRVAELVDGLLDLRDLIMRGKRCVTDTGPAVKPVIELASVHILDDAANALEALTTEPAAPEGRQEAMRIGDAVLDWMVKFDLLDAGNEYYVSDVLAVLNDLTPSTRPAEQAVTEAMAEAACLKWFGDTWPVGMAPKSRAQMLADMSNALKAAMEAGRDV